MSRLASALNRLRPLLNRLRPLGRTLPYAVPTALLAWLSIAAVLEQTGGEATVPLDDAFIHFQYARSFAELRGLAYTPGSAPAPGATSLLWPLLLSPFHALGMRGTTLTWAAWALGFVSLGLLAHETRRAADRVVTPEVGIAASAMVLAFGGYVWCAGSGMEVVPLALILMRAARRAAEWAEGAGRAGPILPRRLELCALGLLAPAMRPEGLLASLLTAAVLIRFPRGSSRAFAAIALLGPAIPPLVNFLGANQVTSTTLQVKWLPASPYQDGARLWQSVIANLEILFGTLLDGRIWSSVFLPSGGRAFAWLALPALVYAGVRRKAPWRACALLVIALGMLIPTSYDSFLWNRLRYLWPFAAAWFIGLAALADAIGDLCARIRAELGSLRILVAGSFVGALAGHLSFTIDDLAGSADAIRRQQVDLGRWAKTTLAPDAVIGVNDTGAIAYFSDRRIFDVVGLTTLGEAPYWAAGAGSRFEHYERLGRERLPSHFIVYPEWLSIPPVLGAFLTERYVPGATILGGTTMVAHEADWSRLGSANTPADMKGLGRLIDELDIADLESEDSHEYRLFWATQAENYVIEHEDGRADGARGFRTLDRFMLELEPGATLVGRFGSDVPVKLTVRVGERTIGSFTLEPNSWQELRLALPADLAPGRALVEVEPPAGGVFESAHYYGYAR